MNPKDLLIDNDAESSTITRLKSFLGIQYEQFTCPDCNEPCAETTTYNPDTAAFDGGACPAWECPDCGKQFHREPDDSMTTLDLYGRGL